MNNSLFSAIIQTAFQSLRRNRSRTALSILGIVIGVSAVTLLITIGEGLQKLVEDQFESFGANNIYIAPGDVFGDGGLGGPQAVAAYSNNPLRYEYIQDLRRIRPMVIDVSATAAQTSQVTYREKQETVTITGVDAPYADITNTTIGKGEFFTQSNNDKKDLVAVLGSQIATDLFGSIDPVQKTILIENKQFKVIGVADAKNAGFGSESVDNYIYIPINTWFDVYDSRQMFESIVKIRSQEEIKPAKQAIIQDLSRYIDEDDFSVFEQTEALGVINQILGGLTAGLGGIAAIALLVGGIGIMNIMLVSVTERTREVGLRKAIGATPRQILLQFLFEAIVLTLVGGVVGIIIAEAAAFLIISRFIPAAVSQNALLLSVSVSVGIGIIFGVYPARKAAKLSPIEAIRYE